MKTTNKMLLAVAAAALTATPAMAQLAGGLGGTVGGAVNGTGAAVGSTVNGGVDATVDPAGTVSSATGRVGNVVNRADSAAQNRVDATSLSLATAQQLQSGIKVRDSQGHMIGTVQRVDGSNAVVVSGSKLYNVPVSQLYAKSAGKVNEVVSKVPKASLTAQANASANGSASGG